MVKLDKKIIPTVLILLFSLLSCNYQQTEDLLKQAENQEEVPVELQHKIYETAVSLQEKENYEDAYKLLSTLKGKKNTLQKIDDKIKELEHLLLIKSLEREQKDTERNAMKHIEDRLIYPKTYGQQLTIKGVDTSPDIPVGPMEELLNRQVSIDLTNASVQDVIMALNRIEGLNLIADNALSSENSLTIKVNNVPLKEVLSYIARNMGIAFHLSENVVWVTAAGPNDENTPKLETAIFRLKSGLLPIIGEDSPVVGGGAAGNNNGFGAGAGGEDELIDAITNFVSFNQPGSLFRIYKNRNLLLVKNTRENIRLVEQLLKEFDSEIKQVLIEARFLTISQQDLRELGANLNTIQREDPNQPKRIQTITNNLLRNFPNTGNIELGGVIDHWEYQFVIHALDEKTSAQTISAPRVTVLNNQTAVIRRGDTLRYFQEYELQTVPNEGGVAVSQPVPTGDVQELNLGITLEVKPAIGHDGKKILLDLRPIISELVQFDVYINARLPRTSENSVETKVMIESGQTVILGGMITENRQKDDDSIPILGRLPLVKHLFSQTSVNKTPLNLIIFVTATLIDASGRTIQIVD